ncbi:MAG: tetratricopeptide repeat protein [Acidobacteria bacterium]|nr:tetratricopeptide repeat protein [Acidobacteriota bacterium]
MRIPGLLLTFALSALLGGAPPPEAPPPAIPAAGPAAVPESKPGIALAHRAETLKRALLTREDILIDKAASEVDLLRREYGSADLLPLVEAMALWALDQGRQGQALVGLRAVAEAERWAPENPTLTGARIALMRRAGPKGWVLSLPDVLKLNRMRLRSESHKWLWMVHHAAWIRLTATVLLWGWALAMTLRYRQVFRHLLEEPLARRGLTPAISALLAALLLSLPVLAGLDLGIAALLWLWLLVPFLSRLEVRFSLVVVLLQLLHPVLAGFEPWAARQPRPSLVALQTQPQPRTQEMARVAARLPREDQEFLKGWGLLQNQDWAAADSLFSGLKARHPNRAEVLNNLGVANYQLGRKEEASKLFDAAFALNPSSVEILVNQSILAFERLDTVTGTGKHEEGRRVNPVHYGQLMSISRTRREQRTFALPLPDDPARSAVLDTVFEAPPPPSDFAWLTLANLLGFLLPLAAFGGILHRLKQSVNLAHPTQCLRCGEPFHTTDSPDPSVCPKCHHLFVLKDGLHQESRRKKLAEVADYQGQQRWIHKTLLLLVPGLDNAFLGQTWEGLLEFTFYAFSVGLVFAMGRTVRYPGEILPDPLSTWFPIGIFLMAILLLRSWIKLLPRRT